jgi:transposase
MARRRKYSAEFKADAVALVSSRPDVSVRDIADELGVPQTVLNQWCRRAGVRAEPKAERAPLPLKEATTARVRELERELARTKMELEFAKKAAAFFAREVK